MFQNVLKSGFVVEDISCGMICEKLFDGNAHATLYPLHITNDIATICSVTDRGMGEIDQYEDVCTTCTSQMTLSQLVEWGKWFNVGLCVRRCTVAHYK